MKNMQAVQPGVERRERRQIHLPGPARIEQRRERVAAVEHARRSQRVSVKSPDRLRIAFIADCLEGLGGGLVSGQRFVTRLRQEHEVTLVSADPPSPGQVALPGFGTSIRRMRENGFVFARPQRDKLARVFAASDIVHLQYPFWLSMVAFEEARKQHLPIVTAFHVQPENVLMNVGVRSQRLSDWLYRFWIDRLYNRSELVICPTAFAERKLREHGLLVPVEQVSNGTVSQATRQPDLRNTRDFFLILMVGRLAREKRQDVLLRALRLCRHRQHVKVVLAGAGPEEGRLRALAERLPNEVEMGFVPQPRLDQLLATCDLFVHASEVELEGMSVLEAMSFGCPVLVADSSESAASTMALDERFSFPAGDEKVLAQRIDALIEQPELRRASGEEYRKIARTFSFEESAQKLVSAYRTAIQLHAAAASKARRSGAAHASSSNRNRTVDRPCRMGTRTVPVALTSSGTESVSRASESHASRTILPTHDSTVSVPSPVLACGRASIE